MIVSLLHINSAATTTFRQFGCILRSHGPLHSCIVFSFRCHSNNCDGWDDQESCGMEEKPQLLGTLGKDSLKVWSNMEHDQKFPIFGSASKFWKRTDSPNQPVVTFSEGKIGSYSQVMKCVLELRMKHQQPPFRRASISIVIGVSSQVIRNPPRDSLLLVRWLDKIPNNSDLPWYKKRQPPWTRDYGLSTDLFTFYLPISHFRVNNCELYPNIYKFGSD